MKDAPNVLSDRKLTDCEQHPLQYTSQSSCPQFSDTHNLQKQEFSLKFSVLLSKFLPFILGITFSTIFPSPKILFFCTNKRSFSLYRLALAPSIFNFRKVAPIYVFFVCQKYSSCYSTTSSIKNIRQTNLNISGRFEYLVVFPNFCPFDQLSGHFLKFLPVQSMQKSAKAMLDTKTIILDNFPPE